VHGHCYMVAHMFSVGTLFGLGWVFLVWLGLSGVPLSVVSDPCDRLPGLNVRV